MEGKVVFEGKSPDGNALIIRYPTSNDAQAMCDYINMLSKEQTFIRFQGEQIDLEFEIKYLKAQLERIEKKQTVQLLVIDNNTLVGISGVDMKDKIESHEGVFGISLAREVRGQGLGKKLMQLTLEEAEKNILQLRIITLGVFSNNELAQGMYKKFGFIQYGKLPKGVLHKGQYRDHLHMYKVVRD